MSENENWRFECHGKQEGCEGDARWRVWFAYAPTYTVLCGNCLHHAFANGMVDDGGDHGRPTQIEAIVPGDSVFHKLSHRRPDERESPDKSNKPSWDDAPEWVMQLAQDVIGRWCWFEATPKPMDGGGWFLSIEVGRSEYVPVQNNIYTPNPYWRDTLEPRPEPEPDDDDDDNPSGFKLAPPPPILWAKPCQDCARSPGMVKAITEGDEADVHWCVECHSCKRHGKWAHTEIEAVAHWNETNGEPSEEAWAAGWNWQPGESDDADKIEFEAEAQTCSQGVLLVCNMQPIEEGARYRVTLTPIEEEPTLKPCPFCGARAELLNNPSGSWYARCSDTVNCTAAVDCLAGRLDEVIRAWNRRAV